ncbi:MAG: transglutaminase domain-containing protein [Anaerolineae bacterium]|nr:transglutaminase domain-containing protein [Anaerolineae bacterium]
MTTVAARRRKLDLGMHEGWSSFVFLAFALIMVTWSINEAGYDESLKHLAFVTMGAILAGLFLVKSRFPWFLTHTLSLMYGVSWIAFVVSYQLPPTFSARDRLIELGYRVGLWFQQTVLGGKVGTDPLMFAVVMSVLFWLITYIALWFSFRAHSLWVALLPSGVVLLFNLYYGPDKIGFVLVPYLLFTFLFIVRYNLYAQETGWRRRRVRYDTDIVYNFLRYGAILSFLTITVAWILPAAARSEQAEMFFSRFSEPWERVKDEWIRLFSTLQSERTEPGFGTFSGALGLGGPVNLGNVTLMDVQAPSGRYWRAMVYDEYTGSGWVSNALDAVYLDEGELPGEMVPHEARRTITQTFTLYMPGTIQMYALSQPEQFSLPVKGTVFRAQSPQGTQQIESLVGVDSRYKLKSGASYMVVSSIASASEDAMRQAGEGYPVWTERYLQLPDDLPQRVRDLAQEITAEYDNAFDKSEALQNYLREYPYNEQIEMPPEGIDRVDYFLFDMKEGYCNYYASAMAVMARSVGIPARVAAGYARGEWERDAQAFRVRQHDSHAWVEVYLPRFGWIEFEPTANEPLIVRPRIAGGPGSDMGDVPSNRSWEDYLDEDQYLNERGMFDAEQFELLLAEQRRQAQIRTWSRVGAVLGVSFVVILIAWWLGRRQMDEDRPARTYYERMVRQGNWWGCEMESYHTPYEYAAKLSALLRHPDGERLIKRIADAYVGERYGQKNPARHQPDFAWRDLRPLLTRWGIRQSWRRLLRRA